MKEKKYSSKIQKMFCILFIEIGGVYIDAYV